MPGLYACGNDMASMMQGAYPGPGATLGPAMVFGYRVGMHAKKSMDKSLTPSVVAPNTEKMHKL